MMQRIPFMKMTGTGNDFIMIDNRAGVVDSNNCRDLVRFACRPKLSVGADGLILIEDDPEVDFKWRFFNADGGEAEMCGNGARCAARFAYLNGIVRKPQMAFRTIAGVIHAEMIGERVKIQATPPHGMDLSIQIEADGRSFSADFINTGVPHLVLALDDEAALEAMDVFRYGRALRFHSRFAPAGTNVNFVLICDSQHIKIRTYERGVEAETLACGTGSIASALIGASRQLLISPVEVETRSGEMLTIHFRPQGPQHFAEVYLEGSARVVYEAELWDETLRA
jgi:diaminopimelate epimerase